MLKKLSLSLGLLIILSCGISAQTKTEKKLGYPVKKDNLIRVLRDSDYKDQGIIETIDKNGVDFELTPAIEKEIKAARNSSQIIDAVRRTHRIAIGVANGKAIYLAVPKYPAAGRAVNAGGTVNVIIVIDKDGQVIDASAISGHPLLWQAAEEAALASKFTPTKISGQKVEVTATIVYNFTR